MSHLFQVLFWLYCAAQLFANALAVKVGPR
jgi:hypothetical protein